MEDFHTNSDKHTTALLVDHDLIELQLMKDELTSRGFTVHTATNAISALSRFMIYKPQLVFLEICLPGIDGFEALKKMCTNAKNMNHRARFVMLTEIRTKSEIIKSVHCGAHDYIAKPITKSSFIEKLQKQLLEIEVLQ
jgi:DNA-binding response OmpR family regulator